PSFLPMKKLCSVPGCSLPHSARGFCSRHYRKQYAAGAFRTSLTPPPPAPPPPDRKESLPVIDYPIFSCDSPSIEEWTFKKELYAATIKQYEENITRRRQACQEKLRQEG